jgi:hypothetical protein
MASKSTCDFFSSEINDGARGIDRPSMPSAAHTDLVGQPEKHFRMIPPSSLAIQIPSDGRLSLCAGQQAVQPREVRRTFRSRERMS